MGGLPRGAIRHSGRSSLDGTNPMGGILFFTGEGAFTGARNGFMFRGRKMVPGRGGASRVRSFRRIRRAHIRRHCRLRPQHRYPTRQSRVVSRHTPSAAGIPLGRQGLSTKSLPTCLFLVSDDGGFITGHHSRHVSTGFY